MIQVCRPGRRQGNKPLAAAGGWRERTPGEERNGGEERGTEVGGGGAATITTAAAAYSKIVASDNSRMIAGVCWFMCLVISEGPVFFLWHNNASFSTFSVS